MVYPAKKAMTIQVRKTCSLLSWLQHAHKLAAAACVLAPMRPVMRLHQRRLRIHTCVERPMLATCAHGSLVRYQ
jgi:hypothetical protein